MDTTKAITHIGLCAGYGGIELGLARVLPTLRSVALCEIEAFPIANLVAKMEAGLMESAPIWTDLKTFPWSSFRDRVDILTGGYPCQPFSSAGKRAGKEDPRHLWPWIADGIRILRPRVCFFENVEGHISLGLSSVISDLEELGYKVSWGIFSASEVGAPHQRKRVFILAHSADQRPEWGSILGSPSASEAVEGCGAWSWPSRPGEPQHGWEPPRVVGNASNEGHSRAEGQSGSRAERESNGYSAKPVNDNRRQAQPSLGGNPDGTSDWMDYAELQKPNHSEGDYKSKFSNGELANSIYDGCDHPNKGLNQDGEQGSLGETTETETRRDWVHSSQYREAFGDDSLYISCDNRTDELRLLGNGVVPATAERAFRVLMNELMNI